MITEIYVTKDGKRFECKAEAQHHADRIALKALLLEAPQRETVVGGQETMHGDFEEALADWILSEPIRAAFLDVLRYE